MCEGQFSQSRRSLTRLPSHRQASKVNITFLHWKRAVCLRMYKCLCLEDAGSHQPSAGCTCTKPGKQCSALQGAIDLVQMELQRRDPQQEFQRMTRYRQFFHPPRRLPAAAAAPLSGLGSLAAPAAAAGNTAEGRAALDGGALAPSVAAAGSGLGLAYQHATPAAPSAGGCSRADAESAVQQRCLPAATSHVGVGVGCTHQRAERPSLAAIRHALRCHSKAPGDGLLHAPLRACLALPAAGELSTPQVSMDSSIL